MSSASSPVSILGQLHSRHVFQRRITILAQGFAQLLPHGATVLDVGCGDGSLASDLMRRRPDVQISGVEVLKRQTTHIPVELFDGLHLPHSDSAFDVVMFSDVLHHTAEPEAVLREAARVARRNVLLKDHFRNGIGARTRLRFMDWVGNARYGVALPYNYWSKAQWEESWSKLNLTTEKLVTDLHLYPAPADWLFGAKLHFLALLRKRGVGASE